MHHRAATRPSPFRYLSLAILLAALVNACGGGASAPDFSACGNGRVDDGEACDDGNQSDSDHCLTTCQLAVCGDRFIDSGGDLTAEELCTLGGSSGGTRPEQCDTRNLNGCSCTSVQLADGTKPFAGGSLACTTSCAFDISGCVTRPTPTPTPSRAATASPTPTRPIESCTQFAVIVALAYDAGQAPELSGLTVDLGYSASLSIPGTGSDDTVFERYTDLSSASGFPGLTDFDQNPASARLETVYAAVGSLMPGDFERIVFDCEDGVTPPLSSLSCSVSQAVDSQGQPVEGVDCSLRADFE